MDIEYQISNISLVAFIWQKYGYYVMIWDVIGRNIALRRPKVTRTSINKLDRYLKVPHKGHLSVCTKQGDNSDELADFAEIIKSEFVR